MTKTSFDLLFESAKAQDISEEALLRSNALPVRWAWEGCFGILRTGEVIYANEDGEIAPFEEEDSRFATLVYAAKKFPEMSSFLPARPEAAVSCAECAGTGHMNTKLGVPGDSMLCYVCRGLGWRVGGTNDA